MYISFISPNGYIIMYSKIRNVHPYVMDLTCVLLYTTDVINKPKNQVYMYKTNKHMCHLVAHVLLHHVQNSNCCMSGPIQCTSSYEFKQHDSYRQHSCVQCWGAFEQLLLTL